MNTKNSHQTGSTGKCALNGYVPGWYFSEVIEYPIPIPQLVVRGDNNDTGTKSALHYNNFHKSGSRAEDI